MLWRKIETELVDILRSDGHELDDEAGDKIIVINDIDAINLTFIAQRLALRLEPAEVK